MLLKGQGGPGLRTDHSLSDRRTAVAAEQMGRNLTGDFFAMVLFCFAFDKRRG